MGKASHWVCVLDEEGEVVLSRRVKATERDVEECCSEIEFSISEIICTVLIVGYAWKWREAAVQPADQPEVAAPPAATAASR